MILGAPFPLDVRAVPLEKIGIINVSWTAPIVPSGELPITGYEIKLHVVNSKHLLCRNVDNTTTSTLVNGLLPNTEYRVYVASLNELNIKELSYCCIYAAEEIFVKTADGKFL